jgi:hypothetical protein
MYSSMRLTVSAQIGMANSVNSTLIAPFFIVVFLLFCKLYILVIRWVYSRCSVRHIRVPLGSVFCWRNSGDLGLLRLACFLFGFHLLNGGG